MNLTSLSNTLVSHVTVTAVGIGVFLNGMGVPGLGEVLLPLGGAGVHQGHFNLSVLFIVAFVCQVLGVCVAYAIARFGGVVLIERYGKYIFISGRELRAAQKAFDRHGEWLVLFGAFIPGIQGFIGYVAGVAEMNFGRFLVSVAIGKIVWIGGLMYLGFVLANHLALIDTYMKQIGVLVLAALIILGVYYLRRHRKNTPKKRLGEEN